MTECGDCEYVWWEDDTEVYRCGRYGNQVLSVGGEMEPDVLDECMKRGTFPGGSGVYCSGDGQLAAE